MSASRLCFFVSEYFKTFIQVGFTHVLQFTITDKCFKQKITESQNLEQRN